MAVPPQSPLQGALDKKGDHGRFASWKRRWFVLKDPASLHYYPSRFSTDLLGTIALSQASQVLPDPSNPLVFRIVPDPDRPKQGRTVVLRAGSADSRQQWVAQLAAREGLFKGPQQRPVSGGGQLTSASFANPAVISPSADVRSLPTAKPKPAEGEVRDEKGVPHWLDY